MRLFVAVPLAEAVRGQAEAVQARLKASGADVKWVEVENLHLTVKFLGDREDALLPDIEAALADVAAATAPFRVRVRGGSSFPKRGPEIKTLLLHVTEGAAEWRALVRRAEEWFALMGVPRENGLAPHVTLGRVRGGRGMAELRAALAAEAEADCGAQDAAGIALVKSTLTPRGALYEDLNRWPLTGAAAARAAEFDDVTKPKE